MDGPPGPDRLLPGIILASLDVVGLVIAGYLSVVELQGALPYCDYGLSLVGVVFELYFTYAEVFVIGAVCVWCASYDLSLLARFAMALWVWRGRTRYSPS